MQYWIVLAAGVALGVGGTLTWLAWYFKDVMK